MRLAPPNASAGDETPPHQPKRRPTDPIRRSPSDSAWAASARWWRAGGPLLWSELAAFALLLAAIVVPLVLASPSSESAAGPSQPPPPINPRPVFQFASPTMSIAALGPTRGVAAAQAAAPRIQAVLSTFYDQAFVDPSTWTKGVPTAAWSIFDAPLRSQAQQDATSLALGAQAPTLTRLDVTDTSLSIRFLVDPGGGLAVAAADIRFTATGELKDGQALQVTNRASFLLRQVSGQWLIVGYPVASTRLDSSAPAPTPTPTQSGTSPTPSASGSSP
jgi:hypothetical protein